MMLKGAMNLSRRAALVAATSVAAAACRRRSSLMTNDGGKRFDTARLNREFPALADRARPAVFAIGIMSLDTTETWYWNTDRAFPLAGLTVAPLAAAALAAADEKRLSLGEPVSFRAADLSAPYSLINQKWPDPPDAYAARAPVSTLLKLALQWGDNTAADVLMSRVGGPDAVTAWLRQHDIKDMRVDRYQRELAVELAAMPSFRPAWKDADAFLAARGEAPARARQSAMDAYLTEPKDTATVPGALDFLSKLAGGQLMSAGSTASLLGWMEAARPGADLLRAGWPHSVRVAHKGAATSTDLGFTATMGDLAIARLPDGRRYAMAGFLAGSTATAGQRAALFADGARLAAAAVG
jgi:beta-lactamase class A